MLKLACQYMRYYKSQTFAIWVSVVLTAALLSGVSSLLYSSQKNKLENSKIMYGNWQYYVTGSEEVLDKVQSRTDGDGFYLEQIGKAQIKDVVTEPYLLYFITADDAYQKMTQRYLVEGSYPRGAQEIAADRYTLGNLGFSGTVGDTIEINSKTYVLSGIIKSDWAANRDEMDVFVSNAFPGRGSQSLFYLRFSEKQKLYRQLNAFQKAYHISAENVTANEEVVRYLGGEKADSIYSIVKFALTDPQGNLTYIVLKLQSEYNLAFHGMILLLCLFSLFVVYSIFSISVSKRISEYGIMQTLGISEGKIGQTLLIELWLLFLSGYPIGCLLGNGILSLCYQKLYGVFLASSINTGAELSATDQIYTEQMTQAAFHVAWPAIEAGFVFLFLALAGVCYATVRSMHKQTVRQIMNGDTSYITRRRRIYSRTKHTLVPVVVRKFMFSNKKKVVGILCSLSLGGCIFLCTTYLTENLKIHADMSLKAEDGLGSEYQVMVKSDQLSDTIPSSVVDEIKNIPGLSHVYATKYTLGELTIKKQELTWKDYFKEPNKDEYFQKHYGGICVENGADTYGIKYDVYGYDTGMLKELRQYILEGEIDPEQLKEEDAVIIVANQDGQGNYDCYGKHPGDTITLRVPKKQENAADLLKFQGSSDQYIEKKCKIAAIASRALAQEKQYLNVDLWSNMPSVILSNPQMETVFGIVDYSLIHASPAVGADAQNAGSQILLALKNVPKAVLQDNTQAIKTQKNYLRQQQAFFSGIALILLVLSMFHIMNSMNYSILSRRREYAIMRAMGITDSGFYRMILRTGLLYGILADILLFLSYQLLFRRIMDYYMVHVVQFLHITASVPQQVLWGIMAGNVLIAMVAVLLPARKIGKDTIVGELKR